MSFFICLEQNHEHEAGNLNKLCFWFNLKKNYGNELAKNNIEDYFFIGNINYGSDVFISDDLTAELAGEGTEYLGEHVEGAYQRLHVE